jgi:DNA polymerase III sliding clamp (beta) subunit (PCNA family)
MTTATVSVNSILVNRKQLDKAVKSLKSLKLKSSYRVGNNDCILESLEDKVILHATDLRTTMSIELAATCGYYGLKLISLDSLSAIIKLDKSASIDIGQVATIGDVNNRYPTIEFFHSDYVGTTIELDSVQVKQVEKVAVVISKDDSKMILTGVNFQGNNTDMFKIAATCGHRLIVASTELNTSEPINFTPTGKYLTNLSKLGLGDKVTITFDTYLNKAIFRSLGVTLAVPMLEGNYPNYGMLIPDEFKTVVVTNVKELQSACQYSVDTKSEYTRLEVTPKKLIVDLVNDEKVITKSFCLDSTSITSDSDQLISFNPKYLLDAVNTFSDNHAVNISMVGDESQVVLTDLDSQILHLIMPVKIR